MYLSASVEPPRSASNALKLGLQLLVCLVVITLVDGEALDVDIRDGCRQGLLVRWQDVDGVFHYGVGHLGYDEGVWEAGGGRGRRARVLRKALWPGRGVGQLNEEGGMMATGQVVASDAD
jgi:hypothetical protein